jgi:hypothetical protein
VFLFSDHAEDKRKESAALRTNAKSVDCTETCNEASAQHRTAEELFSLRIRQLVKVSLIYRGRNDGTTLKFWGR